MKRSFIVIFTLLLLAFSIFALTACGCEHIDKDDDALCDECGESYTDDKDVDDSTPCSHRDADDNSLCDKCGESYTDGKDLPDVHTHDYTVKNTDSKYLASTADCENAATYFYSCSCGDKGTETFTYGTAIDIPVNSITLDKAVANIEVGDTVTLNVLFNPENATDKNVTWISSDSTIALVNNGIVLGIKPGSTTIIAMTANGKTATCLINVSPKTYYAESITLNKASVELPIGYTDTLTATVLPDYTTDKSVIWSSSDSSIVKVENGVITALSAGTVTITATTTNGKSATCTVKSLFILATDIIINEQLIYVDAGENKAVNATTVPENATVTSLIWSSSDTSIATVNDGIITGVSDGIAIITVSTEDGTISKSFNVVVENSAEIIYTSYGSGYSVTAINKFTETLIIPDTYKGKPVTSISANVFGTECRIIKKLYIGNNVTTLPNGIFRNCTNLETLYVPNVKYDYVGDLFGSVQTEYIGTADDFVNETLNGTGDWIYYGDSWLSVDGVYVYVEDLHLSNNNILSWQNAYINGYYMSVPRKVLLTAYYIPKSLVNIYNKNQSAITVESDSACLDKVKDLKVSINGESLSKTLAEVISLSDIEKIKSLGTYSLTVYYGGFVCEISITVTEHTASDAVQENYADSNCTEDGSYDSVTYCYSCNKELSRTSKTVDAKGHSPKAAVEENRVEASCTEDGHYDSVIYCGECNVELSREAKTITKFGHSPKTAVEENRVEATCTEDGDYDSVIYCGKCNVELARENINIPKAHKFASGSCVFCGGLESSSGLAFTLNLDGASYSLTGKGSFSGSNLVIDIYNNLPVTNIDSSAFSDCDNLTSVTIGNSVTSIGNFAFWSCTSLTSVYITDIAAWCGISFGNSSANPLSYAKNLYLNGELVTELVIPDSVTSIGDYAFCDCESLTSVTIPNSVTSIGEKAFSNCNSLTSVTIGNSVTSIGEKAFFNCNSLTSVTIPNSVTSIGEKAFSNCNSLTSVTIPDSVISIGNHAFYDCDNLTSVTIGNSVTTIGDHAFYDCDNLTSVTIGNSVTSIGDYAFYNCTSLTSVTIPNSVTSIGGYAFRDCTSLTSVTIGNGVTSIGSYAFQCCYKLVEVIDHSSLGIAQGSLSNDGFVGYYSKEVHTGESKIKTLNDYLFYTYNGVNYLLGYVGDDKELVLPESDNGNNYEIYDYAFLHCENLTSVTIPNSVTSIGDYAFSGCTSLMIVTIGDSVTSIGDSAFSYCSNLTSIKVDINNTAYKDIDGNLYSKDGKILKQYAIGKIATSFTIPDGVTYIGDAFSGCTSLTSVTIANSVTSIGDHAFYDCDNLTSVTIGNSVTRIGSYAFYNCNSLKSIKYRGTSSQWNSISKGSSWNAYELNGYHYTIRYTITYDYTGK